MTIKENSLPPLGAFFNPFSGFWKNAEPVEGGAFRSIGKLKSLKGEVDVYYDDRSVPHIFADEVMDALFVQGYVTASQRLFQMDVTIRAAGGRLSEVLGERTLERDQLQRRRGMVYAAENTLATWKSDQEGFAMIEAYCAGVNTYIDQLQPADYPLEFKLLNYAPEPWTPLKSALLMKSMAQMLCSRENDLESSNALKFFGRDAFDFLYPEYNPDEVPIIPKDVNWDHIQVDPLSSEKSSPPLGFIQHRALPKPPESLGSNNWAVAGSKTQSGVPILCNDPHLKLTLPSVWFEVQLNTAEFNVYGVSLPGFPGVVIGFNEHIAWGMTNVSHDVMDWHTIDWVDEGKTKYRLDGKEEMAVVRVEEIYLKGQKEPIIDSVKYTVWGPVVYDTKSEYKDMAMNWIAHQGHGNEAKVFYQLNRAKNYEEFKAAAKYFAVPAQNLVFASKEGAIAMQVQGKFPLRKFEQGRFVQSGNTTMNQWKGFIPQEHNPGVLNPVSGFVASANQRSTGEDYPYYYTGGFADYRGRILSRKLSEIQKASIKDMMALQNDEYALKAEEALPTLLEMMEEVELEEEEGRWLSNLREWKYNYGREEMPPILFDEWIRSFYANTWDEFDGIKDSIDILMPETWKTISMLVNLPDHEYFDIQSTPTREIAKDVAVISFQKACNKIKEWKKEHPQTPLTWGNYKTDRVNHLARLPAFSSDELPVGGDRHVLNAIRWGAGPSWRMIVELGEEVKAFGVYPGGQSGNPGSPFYDNMIESWAKGAYYELNLMQERPAKGTYMQEQKFSNGAIERK